jgi:hypothetical protein
MIEARTIKLSDAWTHEVAAEVGYIGIACAQNDVAGSSILPQNE